MEKLKYEFSEDEVNFIIQSLDQVQVKGLQAISFLLNVVQKLKNPINKKEYDAAKAKQISKEITGIDIEAERQKKELQVLKSGKVAKQGG